MTELTIDSGAFATTPTPCPKPCRVAATHAGRKQIDCQGSEAKPMLTPGKLGRLCSPSLARSDECMP